ncbi:LytR/AlgR family response regulator transcription factor [Nonlabens antarcticus]|uniref:LytR/AlgR family response regulator transcription factor n=1 Tax=Nonlabens antarcticus TaxID=392714 RepID=UPI0018911474|nr:response regulator transcription factor [Nonlabens antarcticus]
MDSIKIYILEDEIITQELLKETLEKLQFTVCGMSTNAETALREIAVLQPHIAILDIKVEGSQTGVWLGNQLDIPIIYLTAFNDKKTIKDAISTKPSSYLVKPFIESDLYIAVELAMDRIKNSSQIIVKERDKNIIVSGQDILFAKKEDQYLSLHLTDSKKLIRSSIQQFLDKINSSSFIQVHRSYVVNKNHVTAFTNKEVTIEEYAIPISKTFAKDILDDQSFK